MRHRPLQHFLGPLWHKRDNTRVKAITQILGAKVAKITRNGRQIDGPPRIHQIDGSFLTLCHALTVRFLFTPFEPKRALIASPMQAPRKDYHSHTLTRQHSHNSGVASCPHNVQSSFKNALQSRKTSSLEAYIIFFRTVTKVTAMII